METTQYLHDGWQIVQEQNADGTQNANLLTGLGLDEIYTRTEGTASRHYLTDGLGSVLALADDAGNLVTTYRYGPFGATAAAGETNGNPFQYTGRENDGTGLYYYRNRYYHPSLQRFISEDPIGLGGRQANFYAYARNNPVNWIDPFGLAGSCGGSLQYLGAPDLPIESVCPECWLIGVPGLGLAKTEAAVVGTVAKAATSAGREIKLVDGFYQAEASAFKFSEYYYNKLWSTGRGAPFLQAEEVLSTAKTVTPDRMEGFYRYVNDSFEMVYNPTTKEVWHLQPLGK
jgi:RHS repeat-associated protein